MKSTGITVTCNHNSDSPQSQNKYHTNKFQHTASPRTGGGGDSVLLPRRIIVGCAIIVCGLSVTHLVHISPTVYIYISMQTNHGINHTILVILHWANAASFLRVLFLKRNFHAKLKPELWDVAEYYFKDGASKQICIDTMSHLVYV